MREGGYCDVVGIAGDVGRRFVRPQLYDPGMAFDFPDDLVQLQRGFFAANRRWAEAARGGDDGATERAYRDTHEAVMALYGHPWWETVSVRYQARMALREAAQQDDQLSGQRGGQ